MDKCLILLDIDHELKDKLKTWAFVYGGPRNKWLGARFGFLKAMSVRGEEPPVDELATGAFPFRQSKGIRKSKTGSLKPVRHASIQLSFSLQAWVYLP